MKKCLALLFLLSAWSVQAQSAAVMDGIIGSSGISTAQAAYLVLVASGQLNEDATPEQGFQLLDQLAWAPWLNTAETVLTEADYAWILSRAYRVEGGLWYTLFPGTRYAFREFQYQGFIAASHDPGSSLSGNEAIRVLGKVIDANTLPGAQR